MLNLNLTFDIGSFLDKINSVFVVDTFDDITTPWCDGGRQTQ